jgi:drug/metabolite transporter (DMT)-like permease
MPGLAVEQNKSALISCHIGVLLLGFTALFAKLIPFASIFTVWTRSSIAFVALLFFALITKQSLRLNSKKDYISLLFVGTLLGTHWVTYFYAVQISTVAIGLISLFTFPIMTIFFEAYFFKEQLKKIEYINALVVFVGVLLIVPEFNMNNQISQGVLWGLLSALLYSIRLVYCRKFMKDYSSSVLMTHMSGVSTLILLPFAFFYFPTEPITSQNIVHILVLGTVLTAIAHTLFVNSLAKLKARSAGIIASLQPLYGTFWAFVLLSESPNFKTLIGGSLILIIVLFETYQHK